MAIPQVGAVGLTITVTLTNQNQAPIDLTGITAGVIYLRRPNGRVTTHPVATASASALSYVTVVGDLDVPGEWRIQARLVFGTTADYFSDAQPFRVAENIAS
jgi:hypothetical protein